MTYPTNTTVDTVCGPWVIEQIESIVGLYTGLESIVGLNTGQQYAIYSVPSHKLLAKYYFTVKTDPKETKTLYFTFTDFNLRKLANEMGYVEAVGFSGGYVTYQTEARTIIETVLKKACYRIVDPKFATLT